MFALTNWSYHPLKLDTVATVTKLLMHRVPFVKIKKRQSARQRARYDMQAAGSATAVAVTGLMHTFLFTLLPLHSN